MVWRVVLCTIVAISGVWFAAKLMTSGAFLFDYNGNFYHAGRAILSGQSPYHFGFVAWLAHVKQAGGTLPGSFAVPVYPPLTLLAAAPLSLLPDLAAGLTFQALMVIAMVYGLRLLGVRDWRCIAVALLSWPFMQGVTLGNIGPLLVLGIGFAWRYRDQLWPPAAAVASVVVAKVFPWPLLVWLLITKRFRTFGLAIVIAGIGVLGAWALIGFSGLADYPRMLEDLSYVERSWGVSLVGALMSLGISGAAAELIAIVLALTILFAALQCARRPDGDARALGLAVVAALIGSPVVWTHYLVLLFVPLALISPRLSPAWFAPLLPGLVENPLPSTTPQVICALGLELAAVLYMLAPATPLHWRRGARHSVAAPSPISASSAAPVLASVARRTRRPLRPRRLRLRAAPTSVVRRRGY